MKIFGQEITWIRNANKKYLFLDDLDMLYSQLLTKSIAELAKELNVPPNSIRHRVHKYFLPEMIKNIKKDRRPKEKYYGS